MLADKNRGALKEWVVGILRQHLVPFTVANLKLEASANPGQRWIREKPPIEFVGLCQRGGLEVLTYGKIRQNAATNVTLDGP